MKKLIPKNEFLVTRTRIVKASLDDLLRKYPIVSPFRLRLWRTAERWTIEFDSLISTNRNTKKKAPAFLQVLCGDPDENRTRVTAVKGRCLNRLTTGPLVAEIGLEPTTLRV